MAAASTAVLPPTPKSTDPSSQLRASSSSAITTGFRFSHTLTLPRSLKRVRLKTSVYWIHVQRWSGYGITSRNLAVIRQSSRWEASLLEQVSTLTVSAQRMLRCHSEMTNQYLTAFAEDPIIRGAVMQSADSENIGFSRQLRSA